MNEIIKSEMISRRTAFSLLGLTAVATVLTVSHAEAQTPGMERREERREGREERRDERRGKTPEETTGTDKTPAEKK